MLNETFYLDGVDAKTVGIVLQNPIQFSEPVPVFESDQISGRNGDLVYYDGNYENRSAVAGCYALDKDVFEKISEINKFLLSKKGYRRLISSADPDHFWLAVVQNGSAINHRANLLNPFEIEFDCKPQRFRIDGENAVVFSENGVLENPYGFPASPLVKVSGNGSGTINIGAYRVDILSVDENGIILDSDTMNAYNVNGNQNNKIKASEFPVLVDGENAIAFDGGISGVEIIPRWWEL